MRQYTFQRERYLNDVNNNNIHSRSYLKKPKFRIKNRLDTLAGIKEEKFRKEILKTDGKDQQMFINGIHRYVYPLSYEESIIKDRIDMSELTSSSGRDHSYINNVMSLNEENTSKELSYCEVPYAEWTWDNPALVAAVRTNESGGTSVERQLCAEHLNLDEYGLDVTVFNGSVNGAAARFLMDPGASGTPSVLARDKNVSTGYISQQFLKRSGFRTEKLPPEKQFTVGVMTGHAITCSEIIYNAKLKMGRYNEYIDLYVLPVTSQFDIVLGKPWHNLRKPTYNYEENIMKIDKGNKTFMIHPPTAKCAASSVDINKKIDKWLNSLDSTEESEAVSVNRFVNMITKVDKKLKNKSPIPIYMAVVRVLDEKIEISSAFDADEQFDPAAYEYANKAAEPESQQVPQAEAKTAMGKRMFEKYKDTVFIPKLPAGLPPTAVPPVIPLKADATPVAQKVRPMTKEHAEELKKQIKNYLELGWIRPSNSPWGSIVLFVPKANGKLRMCIDYRAVNDRTLKDKYNLPNIEQIIEMLSGSKYFTTLDLAQGYHQCRLQEEDIPMTAFRSLFGSYEWLVLGFGLTNAVPTFMRMMNNVLQEYIGKFAMCFIDDVIIFSKTEKEHEEQLQQVLSTIEKAGLHCNWDKCHINAEKVTYCGINISKDGLTPIDNKIAAIKDWEKPTTLYAVRSFLGAVGYYRKFIPQFAFIADPLTQLTKKPAPEIKRQKVTAVKISKAKFGRKVKTEDISLEWNADCDRAFEILKEALISIPVLKIPDNEKPYELMVDASGIAMGSVLMQKYEDGLHPVSYYSKKFSNAELNYPVHEQELLALFLALKHWQYLLLGNTVTIYTDHRPLRYLKQQSTLSPRQYRWLTYFSDFDVDIIAVPGTKNIVADVLSRYAYNYNYALLQDRLDQLKIKFLKNTEADPTLSNLIYVKSGFHLLSVLPGIKLLSKIDPEMQKLIDKQNEAIFAFKMGGEVDIKRSLKESYEEDAIASSIIKGNPVSLNYVLASNGLIYYNDGDGCIRLYIPKNAECTPGNRATKFPVKGEVLREKCSLREELIRDVHFMGSRSSNLFYC